MWPSYNSYMYGSVTPMALGGVPQLNFPFRHLVDAAACDPRPSVMKRKREEQANILMTGETWKPVAMAAVSVTIPAVQCGNSLSKF
jgi:hypothetical protein